MNVNERHNRLRNMARLCLRCIGNIAYRRARNEKLLYSRDHQFWITVDSDLLDIAILDWCKLFGDKKGEHRWQLGITDQHGFYHGLLEAIGQNDEYLRKYINAVRIYRDKHVAHIDKASSEGLSIPVLDIPKDSCIYLYNYLLEYEDDNKFFHDRPMISVEQFYQKHYDQANRIYHNSLLMVNSDIQ